MSALFAITLFVSAFLLFFIQPMFAKMILPLLGGTPAVWNTCLVFFQAALLAGYGYAHLAPSWLGVRRQAVLHLGLLLLPVWFLPIAVAGNAAPPSDAYPIPWLLGLLLVSVGLPFFVVSTNGPLLQRWFASTGHPAAKDPYFLFAASNLGSMVALLSYPVLVEPTLSLANHSRLWTVGYGLLVALMFGCAVMVWRARLSSVVRSPWSVAKNPRLRTTDYGLRAARRLRWVALAFVPSSMMLSVTTYLTTDIAAIPLLWVIPLTIYLLSFILVFARRPVLPHFGLARLLPLVILLLALVMLSEATGPVWLLLLLPLLALFMVAMVCHGELARDRPPPEHLTEFYLWLSVGGVLGGLFNALVAPLIFNAVVEYPLVLVLACLLRPVPARDESSSAGKAPERAASLVRSQAGAWERGASPFQFSISVMDLVLPVLLGLLTAGLVLALQSFGEGLVQKLTSSGLEPAQVIVGLGFGPAAVACYTFLHRPMRFGLGIGALLLASACYQGVHGTVIYRERSFFGVHRVSEAHNLRRLVHGNTVHGRQSLDPARRREPLAYYSRTGPIGQVFATFSGAAAKREVAIIGLGAGSLAAYGEAGQHFTYYEIDPAVVRIAWDERYFTFVSDSHARVDYVLGDARLTLKEKAKEHQYGLIIMDAFSSDAIPLHLLTRQALQLYKDKLADDGVMAFHISSRYLDLQPVLSDLAADAKMVCLARDDLEVDRTEADNGKDPSQWLVMAHQREDLKDLARDRRWLELKARRGVSVWTDDFSNIFSVFRWSG